MLSESWRQKAASVALPSKEEEILQEMLLTAEKVLIVLLNVEDDRAR